MTSRNRKQKSKGYKKSEATGINYPPEVKSMSSITKLIATFYGVDKKNWM